jgi:hypothetical protein
MPNSPANQQVPARWLSPTENPWGVEVLDCTANAATMISTTESAEIAKKYNEERRTDGAALQNQTFNPALRVSCHLAYGITQRAADGPIFKSRAMEEKWDIYLYGDRLYFCRSWTGELNYRVTVDCEPPELKILQIETARESDAQIAMRDVDFLIKTHVLRAKALHPLPTNIGQDIEKLALFSFTLYGRLGLYGTFAETIGTSWYTA